MDLTPGEKTVLRQIRALYAIDGQHELQVKALLLQWPPIHHETYRRSYLGLVSKLLIEEVGTQIFRITEAGLSAIGVTIRRPQPARG